MESLKATTGREITKESLTEAETLVANGVSVSKPSEHPMQSGDSFSARLWYRASSKLLGFAVLRCGNPRRLSLES